MIPSASPKKRRRKSDLLFLIGVPLPFAGLYYLTISNFGGIVCFGSTTGCYISEHSTYTLFFLGAALFMLGIAVFVGSFSIRRSIFYPPSKRRTQMFGIAVVILVSLSAASLASAAMNYDEAQCGIDCALPNGWKIVDNPICSSATCTFQIQEFTSHSVSVTGLVLENQTDNGNPILLNTDPHFLVHGHTIGNLTVELPTQVPSGSILIYSLNLSSSTSFSGSTLVP